MTKHEEKGTNYKDFKEEVLKNPEVRREYDKLQPEYDLIQRQLKIREGLAIKLASFEGRHYWRMSDVDKEYWLTQAYGTLKYLHSQGLRLPNGEPLVEEE